MKTYETMIILSAGMEDEEREKKSAHLEEIIKKAGGEKLAISKWGNRKLAYEIKKQSHGYYLLFYYQMEGEQTKVMEREFRLDSLILRFMTVVYEGEVPVEKKESQEEAIAVDEKPQTIPVTKPDVSVDEEALEGERLFAEEILAEKKTTVEGDDIAEEDDLEGENSDSESPSEDEEIEK